jgi:hypothetical protein
VFRQAPGAPVIARKAREMALVGKAAAKRHLDKAFMGLGQGALHARDPQAFWLFRSKSVRIRKHGSCLFPRCVYKVACISECLSIQTVVSIAMTLATPGLTTLIGQKGVH